QLPDRIWEPAYDADGQVRPGAWVAEITGLLDLSSWPEGMRLIVRKEPPHPGARPRFTDPGGHRFTCLATNTKAGQLADLEVRPRRRARCEDRIRCAKDTGLRNLPLHGYAQNQIWCEIVALASELLAWMAMLALTGPARRLEPRRLRLRLLSIAGRIVRGGRRPPPRLAATSPRAPQTPTPITPPPAPTPRRPSPTPALTPGCPAKPTPATRKGNHPGPGNPRPPARQPGHHPDQQPENGPASTPGPPSEDHERFRLVAVYAALCSYDGGAGPTKEAEHNRDCQGVVAMTHA